MLDTSLLLASNLLPLAQLQAPDFQAFAQHALVAGLAATWLVVLGKAGELAGNGENVSLLPPERKLPYDSDAKVAGGLLAIGAVAGLAVAYALQANGQNVQDYWPLSLAVGVVLGIAVPWPLLRQLAKDYLERARLNAEQGNWKEAMQDAAEVERISEVYKAQAIALKQYAAEQRGQQLGGLASTVAAGSPVAGEDTEFAEFLSNYRPGSL